jgi:ribonuclease HI
MPKFKPGFYAVKSGRKPGIYLTWEECKTQVDRFSNAVYKKFYSKEQAEKFIEKKKEDLLFININLNKIQVWTDGCSIENGSLNAKAGIGIFWNKNDSRNISERVPGDQTNNRAEIYAVIRALESCTNKIRPLEIMTDSKYVINAAESWINKWKKNNWLTNKKELVKNKDLFEKMDELIKNRSGKVEFVYVRGHQGDYGNEQADKLAKLGALKEVVFKENDQKSKCTIKDYFNN